MCESHSYCESAGLVCECGERHLDTEGIPLCLKAVETVMYENPTDGYKGMWNWSITNNKECEGLLLDNGHFIANYNDENTENKVDPKFQYYYHPSDPTLFFVAINGSVSDKISPKAYAHTHMSLNDTIVIKEGIKGIMGKKSGISTEDIDLIVRRNIYGLLISERKVFRFEHLALGNNLFCPIIYEF